MLRHVAPPAVDQEALPAGLHGGFVDLVQGHFLLAFAAFQPAVHLVAAGEGGLMRRFDLEVSLPCGAGWQEAEVGRTESPSLEEAGLNFFRRGQGKRGCLGTF